MFKLYFLPLQMFMLITLNAHAMDCDPGDFGDGQLLVEILDDKGGAIYSKKHKITYDKKYKNYVSDQGISLLLRKKEYENSIELKSNSDPSAKSTYVTASRKDGEAIAKINGCPIDRVSLYPTSNEIKEPFIGVQVHVYSMESIQKPMNKSVVNAASVSPDSKSKNRSGNNVSEESLMAFGIVLGKPFTKDMVMSAVKRKSYKSYDLNEYNIYTVVPKVKNPYFTNYEVITYRNLGDLIYKVRGESSQPYFNDREKINAIIDSLSKKYGQPKYKKADKRTSIPQHIVYHINGDLAQVNGEGPRYAIILSRGDIEYLDKKAYYTYQKYQEDIQRQKERKTGKQIPIDSGL